MSATSIRRSPKTRSPKPATDSARMPPLRLAPGGRAFFVPSRTTVIHKRFAPWLLACAFALGGAIGPARATPIVPHDDAQVIQVLPLKGSRRAEERRLRRELLAHPQDAQRATQLARLHIEQARASGDPRQAGQALAALQGWPDPASAPSDVLLMQATVHQYLHEFDQAAALLERLVEREVRHPQAWLTLATVRRVQGRYADSDRACARLASIGVALYSGACLAENESLRGDSDRARERLKRLLADDRLNGATRNWLLTTQAELEERGGRVQAAEAAFRAALAASSDNNYTLIAYADHWIERGRYGEALAALQGQPRNDAVLLRLAIAGTLARAAHAPRDAAEMRERIAQANLRPEAQSVHAREQAMFALWVEGQPARALELARANVRTQREPIDLLVFARAAKAARQTDALREVAQLRAQIGLHDRRLDALL
jgi:predicted Zn-dependent protease